MLFLLDVRFPDGSRKSYSLGVRPLWLDPQSWLKVAVSGLFTLFAGHLLEIVDLRRPLRRIRRILRQIREMPKLISKSLWAVSLIGIVWPLPAISSHVSDVPSHTLGHIAFIVGYLLLVAAWMLVGFGLWYMRWRRPVEWWNRQTNRLRENAWALHSTGLALLIL